MVLKKVKVADFGASSVLYFPSSLFSLLVVLVVLVVRYELHCTSARMSGCLTETL